MGDNQKKSKGTLSCRRVRTDVRRHGWPNQDPAMRAAVSRHLKDCPSCTEWVRTVEASLALYSAAPDVAVPPSVFQRLEARLTPQQGKPT